MEASPDTIIEVREELMVSPSSGGNPIRRTAYFLKPCVSSIKESESDFLLPHSLFSGTATSNPSKLSPKVRYDGWRSPQEEWKTWVQQMQPKYEYLWIKAGIDKAIKASTYEIPRKDELILELAQRWCSKTNTFIFPWGEATITLEDMKVLGGYSVMGAPVSSPLETHQQKEREAELVAARRFFNSTKARKVVHKPWMMHFMKNESKVEHEAFLVLWLSRFVFPANAHNTILKSVFPIAIHLARGTEMALATAVLASIYRDLSLLNSNINSATSKCRGSLSLWAPFHLVQVWALERFQALQPHPHAIEQGQPRMARWHLVKMLKNKNLKLTLDSAGVRNGFLWRPYKNSYMDKQSFGRCLRVSEFEDMGCIQQYLPHRVAMQFGMDQDIPGVVARCKKDPWTLSKKKKDPWINYSQPIMDTNLCIALCASQPYVTSRYYDWWKQLKLGMERDTVKGYDHCCLTSISGSEHLSPASSCGPPPGFTSKFKRDQEVVGNGKALSCPQSGDFPSSRVDDETAGSRSKDVLRGSKRTMEDGQIENIVGGAKRAKDDGDEAKIKSPFCDRNGAPNMEGEGASPCTVDIASNLENRIWKLERVVAKLKAARFGPKVESIGAKAKP